jgi:hypothetical protein
MSRLFLLRFSILSFKKLINSKIKIIINLSISVIIFALTASFISILFENRIEQLETKVTKNEINQMLYTKWLNRSPKIIIQINNSVQNRKNEILYADVLKELPGFKGLHTKRMEYFNYYFFQSDLAEINFKNMNLALIDALLLANSSQDIKLIEEQKLALSNLIFKFDKNRSKRFDYQNKIKGSEKKNNDLYYIGFDQFIKINSEIITEQREFFLIFVSNYFSNKRQLFSNDNLENLTEINDLATLETKFIFVAFLIQFIIFIILQIFEVSIERERKKDAKI